MKTALLIAFSFPLLLFSQETKTIAPADFFQQIREHHPRALQAGLLDDEAAAALLSAKGGFDPKLYGDWERKSFDGKTYYNVGEGGLKMPTWFGMEGKVGYGFASGNFVNPENKLPANGQAVIGLSMPLLQGLLLDERRANLFQARIFRQANVAERRAMMNDLMLDAAKSYWDWALASTWAEVYGRAVEAAATRLEGIREGWRQGDLPAIDTLEAFILLQDRQLEKNAADVYFQNAILALQNFLWNNGQPLALPKEARPVALDVAALTSLDLNERADTLALQHPTVLQYRFKLQSLDMERRLKREMLKPRLDVSYNLLGNGLALSPEYGGLFSDNYKWGVKAGFPIFFRKERGSLQLAELKILGTEYELAQKRQDIQNKIAAYQNELDNLRRQLSIASAMQDNYIRLLEAENEKFAIGESSLFLLVSRENKLIEAQLKLAKMQSEFKKSEASLAWAMGLLE